MQLYGITPTNNKVLTSVTKFLIIERYSIIIMLISRTIPEKYNQCLETYFKHRFEDVFFIDQVA